MRQCAKVLEQKVLKKEPNTQTVKMSFLLHGLYFLYRPTAYLPICLVIIAIFGYLLLSFSFSYFVVYVIIKQTWLNFI